MGFAQISARSLVARNQGERHHAAKHSDDIVEAARLLHEQGWGYRKLARHFGVPWSTMRDWCNYKRR